MAVVAQVQHRTAVVLRVDEEQEGLQITAAVFGFLTRDPVAATGMGMLAGTWGTVALTTLASTPGVTSAGLGVLLLTAGLVMQVPAATAASSKLSQPTNPADRPARVMLLGGEPFTEPVIMWWNFIGRTHEEIVGYRDEWQAGSERFGHVQGYTGPVPRLPAPPMPGVRLKPRLTPPGPGDPSVWG